MSLGVTIEDTHIDIRRGFVDVPVLVRGAEARVDNEGREGEHERGEAGGVLDELQNVPGEIAHRVKRIIFEENSR